MRDQEIAQLQEKHNNLKEEIDVLPVFAAVAKFKTIVTTNTTNYENMVLTIKDAMQRIREFDITETFSDREQKERVCRGRKGEKQFLRNCFSETLSVPS